MPKPKNILPTEPLRLSTTPVVIRYLKQLVLTGLYGKNETEAAEQLIRTALKRQIKDGELHKLPEYNPDDYD